jgi:predicted O-methyltransferase YrrM
VDLFPTAASHRVAQKNLERFEIANWIEMCAGSTDTWAEKLHDQQFNFVFIDADHTYKAVKTDFWNWSPMIKEGGWVAFHDTNQDFSHQAITDSVEKEWPELKQFHIDRIRTFQKVTT